MSDTKRPLGCLSFPPLAWLFGGDAASQSINRGDVLPSVMVNKFFLSDAERAALHMLRRAVGDRGHVLAQVSLRQLVWFPPRGKDRAEASLRAKWENKMSRRSIDFVVCKADTLKPVLAIELDDKSHAKPERQTRDDEVERVLEAAGLALVHVLAGSDLDVGTFAEIVEPHLKS